jgi:TonB family protein
VKKEILLSCLLHILIIGVYPTVLLSKKSSAYPMEVYQVSLLTMPSVKPSTSVVSGEESSVPDKKDRGKDKKKEANKEGSSQGKGSGGQITTQQGDFKYSYYLDIILTKMGENWRNPCEGEGGKISAVVYFVIKRDGTIDKVKIDKSSGNYYFDQAAVRAVYTVKNFPPLPDEFERGWLGVYFEFEYASE